LPAAFLEFVGLLVRIPHLRDEGPPRLFCGLYKPIHPARISQRDPSPTTIQSSTPCSNGRTPTCRKLPREIPEPIKNNVTVSPIFAAADSAAYTRAPAGTYVFTTAARQNNPINHGH